MPMDPWKINIDALKPTAGTFGRFHSNLSASMANTTTNAELTITLRVQLVPIVTFEDFRNIFPPKWQPFVRLVTPDKTYKREWSATPDTGDPIEIAAWTPTDWWKWKETYQKEGQKHWHGKFWLQTPSTWTKFDVWGPGKTSFRPNVWCRFVLDVRDTPFPDGAHKVISVVKLANDEFFRSDDSNYDDGDIKLVDKGGGHKQKAFVHELGHALGMDHIANLIDPIRCPAGSGDTACYGATFNERANVMGSGMKLAKVNALPWVERIAEHTGTSKTDWKVFMHRVYPKMV